MKIKYLRIKVKRTSKERHAYLQNKPSLPLTEINPFKTENEKYVEVSESILHSCFTKIDKAIPQTLKLNEVFEIIKRRAK